MSFPLFDIAKNLFVKVWPLAVFSLVISNFFLSCRAYRHCTPYPVDHHHWHYSTNYIFSVVTQFIASASSAASPSEEPLPDPREYPCNDYLYMIVPRGKCVRLWGRYHFVGSRTSRGRIVDIFPDRVILDTGDSITNSGGGDRAYERRPGGGDNKASRRDIIPAR